MVSHSLDVCDDAGVVHVFFFALNFDHTGRKGLYMLTRVSSLVVALAAMLVVGCSEMPTSQLESAEHLL